MLGQIDRHLHRAVEHHIERQLVGQRRGDAVVRPGRAIVEMDDAGRIVERPRQEPGEGQDRSVVRGVAAVRAAAIIFLSPRAFAAQQIGPGAAQAGVLDGVVREDGVMVPRRRLHDLLQALDRILAIGPFGLVQTRPDIAQFDRPHAVAVIIVERGFELAQIIPHLPAGFVMADQVHPLGTRMSRHLGHIEGGLRAVEQEARMAVLPPFGHVPADIPSLDQYALDPVRRRPVDIGFGLGGGRAQLRPRLPGQQAGMHRPEDADIFLRLHPGHVAQPVGLVEVEDDGRVRQMRRIRGHHHHPPRRHRPAMRPRPVAIGPGREIRLERAAILLGHTQVHRGEIDQRGFVHRHRDAVALQRQWGLRGLDRRQRRPAIFILAIFLAIGRDRPGAVVLREVKLGPFVGHDQRLCRQARQRIAKAEPVIEDAELDAQPAPVRRG